MSQLAQLQSDFQAYLMVDVKGAAFKAHIINDKKVGVKKRLGIYYDGYRLRIIEALANAYPILKAKALFYTYFFIINNVRFKRRAFHIIH